MDEALLVDAPPSASTAPGVGPAGSGPCTPANAAADGRDRAAAGRLPVLATALALTWLNPHVYLDTLVLLGSVADAHGDARWAFATGAVVASATWFTGLGRGAAFLRPVFARPAAWRVLDGLVAIVMVAIAGMLLAGA